MSEPSHVALPAAANLDFRAITPADIDQWLALIERIAAAENPPWHDQRADLEQVFASRKNDPAVNTVLGLDADGVARAYGRVAKNVGGPKAYAFGGVDPLWQRRGIGSAVLRWQLSQAKRRFAEDGQARVVVRAHSQEDNAAERALLFGTGFSPVRYFTEMVRPLAGDLPHVAVDAGIDLVPFTSDRSEEVRAAHNEAFADHWGSEPRDEEAWGFMVNHPLARPDWSTVAVDRGTGDVVGYQLASYDPDPLTTQGRQEGYTELLGIRRPWRGRRIAAALLADAMERFRLAGMDYATLDVDTENPTGAFGLYERMGFRPTHRSAAWDCEPG